MPRPSPRRPRLVLQGVLDRDREVGIGFTIDQGAGSRYYEIRIPAELLIEGRVLDCLDRAARRKLNAHWDDLREGAQPTLPWD